jgi:hypothetical protein
MAKKRTPPMNHAAESTASAQQELKRVLDVKWWRWRKCYLEAKKLELEIRRAEGV